MMNVPKLVAILLLSLCSFPLLSQDNGERRSLTIDDLLAMKSVSDPDISPDGAWITYAVERVDQEKDESSTQIYMVSKNGNDVLQMTADDYSASSPRFSPDGSLLSFLAAKGDDEDAKTQVWTLDLRGGDARQYTDAEQEISDYAWSPDGRQMLLVMKDKSAADLAREQAKEAGEEPKPLPYVIDRLQFKRDGQPYLDRSRTHIYVMGERKSPARQLTSGDFDDYAAAFSPDGKAIAFVSNRSEEPDGNENSDIWITDVADEMSEPRRITQNEGADYAPAWSPDGRQIAYVTVTEPDLIWYATNHLAVVSADGGDARVLTGGLDRNVSSPAYSNDGAAIVFVLEDSAEQHLATFDIANAALNRPIEGNLVVQDYAQSDTGDIAVLVSMPHLPAEVFLLSNDSLKPLTKTNAALLDELELGEVTNVSFNSKDGTEVEGFIFTPPQYEDGMRYPTILRLHGGPVSQYDFSFNAEAQLLAANDYVVVIANPRGSSGYGQDFSAALFANWGVPDFEDVMAAVDYAVEEAYADPERLGVGGWSYGGILTNYVITKTDRFEAAITGASEVNFQANYGHDHYQHAWEKELGLPWETPEVWQAISPWENVDKIVTPTLVMGGKEDWNVPIQNSEQLYQALKRRGVPSQLVVYPDESHGISRPSFQKDRWQRYLGWYDEYVRGR